MVGAACQARVARRLAAPLRTSELLCPQLRRTRAAATAPHQRNDRRIWNMKPAPGAARLARPKAADVAGRCRLHGGASTGPTAEGRRRISEFQKARWARLRAGGESLAQSLPSIQRKSTLGEGCSASFRRWRRTLRRCLKCGRGWKIAGSMWRGSCRVQFF